MKVNFFFLVMLLLSSNALAQVTPPAASGPTVGSKPLVPLKPAAPASCKLVGTVKGTKLWAGDCVASEQLRSSLPATSANEAPLLERAADAIPSSQK
jgi:hypothetical protein